MLFTDYCKHHREGLFRFIHLLDERGVVVRSHTTIEIFDKAQGIANFLLNKCGFKKNDRIGLLFSPSVDFIAAFIGCLFAGVIAVSVTPVVWISNSSDIQRFLNICEQCDCKYILTDSVFLSFVNAGRLKAKIQGYRDEQQKKYLQLEFISISAVKGADRTHVFHNPDPEDIAFIQFSSGSTGDPKGICITHKNLSHNTEVFLGNCTSWSSSISVVTWLPTYHDLGLITSLVGTLEVSTIFNKLVYDELLPFRDLNYNIIDRDTVSYPRGIPCNILDDEEICVREASFSKSLDLQPQKPVTSYRPNIEYQSVTEELELMAKSPLLDNLMLESSLNLAIKRRAFRLWNEGAWSIVETLLSVFVYATDGYIQKWDRGSHIDIRTAQGQKEYAALIRFADNHLRELCPDLSGDYQSLLKIRVDRIIRHEKISYRKVNLDFYDPNVTRLLGYNNVLNQLTDIETNMDDIPEGLILLNPSQMGVAPILQLGYANPSDYISRVRALQIYSITKSALYLMSPLDFMKNPLGFFHAYIERSHSSASSSVIPCFALALITRRFSSLPTFGKIEFLKQSGPLHNLAVLGLAAEPIRADTVSKFLEVFTPLGFNPNVIIGCYGLAENTVFTTTNRIHGGLFHANISEIALRDGIIQPGSKTLYSLGWSKGDNGIQVLIVSDGRILPCGEIGEIIVGGDSVAAGYYREICDSIKNSKEIAEDNDSNSKSNSSDIESSDIQENKRYKCTNPDSCFNVNFTDISNFSLYYNGPMVKNWVSTGDLGFIMRHGDKYQLYFASRSKDLIIVNGRNYFPSDIETAVEQTSEKTSIRAGCIASFQIESTLTGLDAEAIVVVMETNKVIQKWRGSNVSKELTNQLKHISSAIRDSVGLLPDILIYVPTNTIPKTTSGKVRRNETKSQLLEGNLKVLARVDQPMFRNLGISRIKNNTDIKTDENNTDIKTDENNTDIKTDENNIDIKTDENNIDIKTDENNTDIKTDENNIDIKTDENNTDIKTDENNTDIKTDENNIDIKTGEELDISTSIREVLDKLRVALENEEVDNGANFIIELLFHLGLGCGTLNETRERWKVDQGLEEQGLESLGVVALFNMLSIVHRESIECSVLVSYPTPLALSQYLMEKIGMKFAAFDNMDKMNVALRKAYNSHIPNNQQQSIKYFQNDAKIIKVKSMNSYTEEFTRFSSDYPVTTCAMILFLVLSSVSILHWFKVMKTYIIPLPKTIFGNFREKRFVHWNTFLSTQLPYQILTSILYTIVTSLKHRYGYNSKWEKTFNILQLLCYTAIIPALGKSTYHFVISSLIVYALQPFTREPPAWIRYNKYGSIAVTIYVAIVEYKSPIVLLIMCYLKPKSSRTLKLIVNLAWKYHMMRCYSFLEDSKGTTVNKGQLFLYLFSPARFFSGPISTWESQIISERLVNHAWSAWRASPPNQRQDPIPYQLAISEGIKLGVILILVELLPNTIMYPTLFSLAPMIGQGLLGNICSSFMALSSYVRWNMGNVLGLLEGLPPVAEFKGSLWELTSSPGTLWRGYHRSWTQWFQKYIFYRLGGSLFALILSTVVSVLIHGRDLHWVYLFAGFLALQILERYSDKLPILPTRILLRSGVIYLMAWLITLPPTPLSVFYCTTPLIIIYEVEHWIKKE